MMADPLSLTLAVITLATMLKDVVELAQKLNDSFKKSASNMREAKSLAAETLEIVQDLKKFCDRHQETLDDDRDLREVVTTLLKDMKSVYEGCLPLLETSEASKSKLHKFKYNLNFWRNRNVVEKNVRDLKEKANKCYRRFTIFTQLDTAAGVVELRGVTIQGFAELHRQQSTLRVSDDNIAAFLGSTPVILSHLPRHVQLSEHLIYRSYITLQVGKIDTHFQDLASSGSHPTEEPDSLHLKPLTLLIWLKPSTEEEMESVQSGIFAQIVNIQEALKALKGGHITASIQQGAWAMLNLTTWLGNLEMFQESLITARCAVDLYKTLIKTNEVAFGSRLAHALRQMTFALVATGDLVQAYKTITEAVTLGRRLVATDATFEAQIQLAELVGFSARVARLNQDMQNSARDAEKAVQSYERLLGNPASFLQSNINVMNRERGPTVMSSEGTHVMRFAEALEELHHSLFALGKKDESMKAGLKALELYNNLARRHSNNAFSSQIAPLSFFLSSSLLRDMISNDQALLYAQQSVQHYKVVAFQTTGVVSEGLVNALSMEAKLLSSLGRLDEAYLSCQNLERMTNNHIDSHRLRAHSLLQITVNLHNSKRHAEAAVAGEQLLTTYQSSLTDDHGVSIAYKFTCLAFAKIGHHQKSIQIADAAVTHWRVLSFRHAKHLKYLANSLFILSISLLEKKDYSRALDEGHEAMKLYSSLIKEDTSLLMDFIYTFRLHMGIAKISKIQFKSMERIREVVQHCRDLVKRFPSQQTLLIRLIRDYANLLEDCDQLADANAAIEECLGWFDDHPAQDEDLTELHLACLVDSVRFLCSHGNPYKTLSLHDKAIAVGQPFMDAYPVARQMFLIKISNVAALSLIGRSSLALDGIEDCHKFASQYNLKEDEAYIECLDISSLIYRRSGRVDKALSVIRQSISINREPERKPPIWVLSDLLADVGEDVEALNEVRGIIQEWEKPTSNLLTTEKQLYARAQYSLGLRLFANNEPSRAREVLLEVRAFYELHSRGTNLWHVRLATTIWALGVLECASGRHEEGIAARNDLNDLRERLRSIFPSLDNLVEVVLNYERNFQAWKNLLKKYNLTCGHQLYI